VSRHVLDGPAIRARIELARENLTVAVGNTLFDLGRTGQGLAETILDEISCELGGIEQLLGDPDE
jgi:hypothetical protein